MPSLRSAYDSSVFINCPFDRAYKALFQGIVFAVHDCGFVARSALELSDTSQVRITKITDLISRCRYGIHDLSRTELDDVHQLPRFNMPLELGLFLGAKWLGTKTQRAKNCLVLDREPYRYQKFCSDIAGQDIMAHGYDPAIAVRAVRDWLADADRETIRPSGRKIFERYTQFQQDLPVYCEALRQEPEELTFNDYSNLVVTWLKRDS